MKNRNNLVKIFTLLYIFFHGFVSIAQNTTLPVAAIEGQADVSLMGMANYTIPVKVIPGTAGIEPNLSITYNSGGGFGLLGLKWDIGGLSSISRTPLNLYHDNSVRGVAMDNHDRFALDGNRLIKTSSGTYGANGTVYGTEIESFVKITSYGTAGNGPEYFEAITEDGKRIEYGRNANARQTLGNSVMTWLINKITDADGNYMTFSYTHSYANPLILEIKYTGNTGANLSTYAKVRFNYVNNTIDINDYYVMGDWFRQSRLLDNIQLFYGSTQVGKYEFKYDITHRTHLTEIKYFGEQSQEINSTKMTWGAKKNPFSRIRTLSTEQGSLIIPGDFNGDGIADYVLYNLNGNMSTASWKMYYGSNTGSFIYQCGGTHQYYSQFYVADVNGDGRDELIIGERDSYQSTTVKFRTITFSGSSFSSNNIATINNFARMLFGDFNGDGKCDIMFVNGNKMATFWGIYHPVIQFPSLQFEAFDFNGNGKTNIQCRNNGETKIYEYDNLTSAINSLVTLGFPTGWHPGVYYGDFNGDGKHDILSYTEAGSWDVNLSTGSGYSWPHSAGPPLENFRGNYAPYYSEPVIVDLNGDGKDDIVQFCKRGNSVYIEVYFTKNFYNNQLYYEKKEYTHSALIDKSPSKYQFADFNGDGILDIIYKEQINSNPVIIYMFENEQFDLVQKITDGMGLETEWIYRTLSSPTVGYTSQHRRKVNWGVVEYMKYSNGIGNGKNTVTYGFGLPNYDFKRRQFLGFEGVTILYNGETTYYHFQENTVFKYLYLHQLMKYRGSASTPISEELNHYEFHDLGNKRFIPYKYGSTTTNSLTGATIRNKIRLRSDGRVDSLIVEHYDVPFGGTPLTREITKYTYIAGTAANGAPVFKPYNVIITSQMRGSSESLTQTTTYNYSTYGRLSSMRKTSASDGYSETFYSNYNSLGIPLTKRISANGLSRTETYQYDNTGRFMTQRKNALNQISYYTFNVQTGNLLSVKDVNGLTTTYTYDALGRRISSNYPDGTRDSLATKWAESLYVATLIPNVKYYTQDYSTGKNAVRIYYDVLGRELSREESEIFTDTRYNALGQVTQVSLPYSSYRTTDNNKRWKKYTYDVYGRILTEISDYKNITYTYAPGRETTRDNIRGVSYVKNYDAAGRVVSTSDPGGTISYQYKIVRTDNKIRTETSILTNGSTTKYVNDSRGNRITLIDPDAGTVTNTYNNFNELLTTKDANGAVTTYTYDALGRVTSKKFSKNGTQDSYTYQYDRSGSTNKGIGKLAYIYANSVLAESLEYDIKGRLSKQTKMINGRSFVQTYSYNNQGFLDEIGYPDQFSIKHIYTGGRLYEIRKSDDNTLIYKVHSRNPFREVKVCSYGNNIGRAYSYDANGLVTQIKTGNKRDGGIVIEKPDPGAGGGVISPVAIFPPADIYFEVDNTYQQLDYTYNARGIMSGRTNANNSQSETFTYDNMDRLTGFQINGGSAKSVGYSLSGNINSHSNVGSYSYNSGNTHPHGVKKVKFNTSGRQGLATGSSCVTYNAMNRPATITEGIYSYQLSYGHDKNRNMSKTLKNGTVESTRYYVSDLFEVLETGNGSHYLNYIYGDNGIVAIFEKSAPSSGTGNMYYVHTDHLGSYSFLTDKNKQIVMSCHFDPWGNRMQYDNWSKKDTVNYSIINRGFTGHEHLDRFKIINMNARLYDPAIGRFFSPDPYIQMADFTQSYNRYSYCLNNPLMYTDPSGEFFVVDSWIVGLFSGGIKEANKRAMNDVKIWGGLFVSDPNKNFWGRAWETVSRFTWQLPQTIAGFLTSHTHNTFGLRGGVESVDYKYGATVLQTNTSWGAVTLGSYIIGSKSIRADENNSLFQHEYGHYLQSQASGLWYLQRYGIPSAFSKGDHDYHPAEQDANARALNYFNKNIDGFADNNQWNFNSNPIIGYDQNLSYNHTNNQLALDYARLQPAWYDWVLGPNIIINGPLINTFTLNSKKHYFDKLRELEHLGLPVSSDAWDRFN